MKTGINLITQEGKERLRLSRINAKIRMIAYAALGVFLVVISFVLIFFLISQKTLNDNNKKIQAIKLNIEKFNKEESYLITTTNRAAIVNNIFKDRKNYSEVLGVISTLFVPGFDPQSLDIVSPNELKISGRCEDLASLTNFNERVEEIKLRKVFSTIVYPQVNRSTNGGFSVSLELKK